MPRYSRLLPGSASVVERQLGHADDAVHRRADLVAHIGEEVALGPVGAPAATSLATVSSPAVARCNSAVVRSNSSIRARRAWAASLPGLARPQRFQFLVLNSSWMRRFSCKNLPMQQGANAALQHRHVARLADKVVGAGLKGKRQILLVLCPVSISTATGLSRVARNSLMRRHTSMPFGVGHHQIDQHTVGNDSAHDGSSPSRPPHAPSIWWPSRPNCSDRYVEVGRAVVNGQQPRVAEVRVGLTQDRGLEGRVCLRSERMLPQQQDVGIDRLSARSRRHCSPGRGPRSPLLSSPVIVRTGMLRVSIFDGRIRRQNSSPPGCPGR